MQAKIYPPSCDSIHDLLQRHISSICTSNDVVKAFDEFSEPVIASLGNHGKLSIIKAGKHEAFPTKDGVTIAYNMKADTPVKQAMYEVFRQASINADLQGGDGTTSTIAIARAIIDSSKNADAETVDIALRLLKAILQKSDLEFGFNGNEDKKELLKMVALTASNGDQEVADIVSRAFDEVGQNGNVLFKIDSKREIDLIVNDGFEACVTPSSMSFIRQEKEILVDPMFIVSEKPIFRVEEIMNVLGFAVEQKRPLVIIASGFDGSAISIPLKNHLESNGQLVCFEYSTVDKVLLRHIAVVTGAFLIPAETTSIANVLKSEDAIMKVIGGASSCQVNSDGIIIVEGLGKEKISEELSFMASNSLGLTPKESEKRMRALLGRTATILVGGKSNAERRELYDRVEDTVNSYRHAITGGLTVGAGQAYIQLMMTNLEYIEKLPKDARTIIYHACLAVFRHLKHNKDRIAFDKKDIPLLMSAIESGKFVLPVSPISTPCDDIMEFGIVDAIPVLRSSMENAISIAELILNCRGVVINDD